MKARFRYARVVIMEHTMEVPEGSFDEDGFYVGFGLAGAGEPLGLPGVYEGFHAMDIPEHVEAVEDYGEIWEVWEDKEE